VNLKNRKKKEGLVTSKFHTKKEKLTEKKEE
jgi:hypothetical protein